jgi:hypothetical protein
MNSYPAINDHQAAHAWAKHLGLDLEEFRHIPLGQAALVLDILANNRVPGSTHAIPQYVIRTLAAMERTNVSRETSDEPQGDGSLMTDRDRIIRLTTDVIQDTDKFDNTSYEDLAEAVVDALYATGDLVDREPRGPRSSDEPRPEGMAAS